MNGLPQTGITPAAIDRARANVRMVEGGNGAGFLAEATVAIGIGGRFGREHLDCDGRPEPGVVGRIHHVHTAAADLGINEIEETRSGTESVIITVNLCLSSIQRRDEFAANHAGRTEPPSHRRRRFVILQQRSEDSRRSSGVLAWYANCGLLISGAVVT